MIGPPGGHGLAVLYGNQRWDSGLGQSIIHGHVVGATTILNLSRHSYCAGHPCFLLVFQLLEDVDGGIPEVSDLHLLDAGFPTRVSDVL